METYDIAAAIADQRRYEAARAAAFADTLEHFGRSEAFPDCLRAGTDHAAAEDYFRARLAAHMAVQGA